MYMKEYRVLFVCLGNICRSPAAEGIFKAMVKAERLDGKISIDSAGTAGYHAGDLPDSRMRRHALRRGYTLDSMARRFTCNDFDKFDIIPVMDDNNYRDVMRMAPDLEAEKKVYRMAEFLQHFVHDHIPDPYYLGADGFELVLDLLEDACEGLLGKMKKGEL
jgi:protein-tyrosine phosphatase